MEQEMNSSKFFSTSTLLYFLLIIIIGNLFIIDVSIFGGKNSVTESQQISNTKTTVSTEVVSKKPAPTEKVAAPKKEIVQTIVNSSSSKEFFVPLGSGSSTSTEWYDIPGATAYVDSTLYENISKVTFEASLYTPTGNQIANARLFNVSDGHPVWNSEVTIEGGTPQLKISGNIILDKGNKLYQVQLKTQLQDRTNLENARIHIITK